MKCRRKSKGHSNAHWSDHYGSGRPTSHDHSLSLFSATSSISLSGFNSLSHNIVYRVAKSSNFVSSSVVLRFVLPAQVPSEGPLKPRKADRNRVCLNLVGRLHTNTDHIDCPTFVLVLFSLFFLFVLLVLFLFLFFVGDKGYIQILDEVEIGEPNSKK